MLKFQRYLFLTFLLSFFIHCAQAGDINKTAVKNAYTDWCSAVGKAKGRASVMVKFYAPDATLLPTLSPKILVNRHNGLDAYFIKFTGTPNIQCMPEKLVTQLYGDIAINSGLYNFSYTEKDGKTKTIAARFTFVYQLDNKKWLIVSHHSSILPVE